MHSATEIPTQTVLLLIKINAQAKVYKFNGLQILSYNDVFHLNVPVSNGHSMQKQQSIRQAFKDVLYFSMVKLSSFCQSTQSMWKIFQYQITIAIFDKIIVICDNVLVLYLFVELVFFILTFWSCTDHFNGNEFIGQHILGFKDLPRQPSPYLLYYFVSVLEYTIYLQFTLHLQTRLIGQFNSTIGQVQILTFLKFIKLLIVCFIIMSKWPFRLIYRPCCINIADDLIDLFVLQVCCGWLVRNFIATLVLFHKFFQSIIIEFSILRRLRFYLCVIQSGTVSLDWVICFGLLISYIQGAESLPRLIFLLWFTIKNCSSYQLLLLLQNLILLKNSF